MTSRTILDAVCYVFNVSVHDLSANGGNNNVISARAIYAHLCKSFGLNMTHCMAEIGRVKSYYIKPLKRQYEERKERLEKARQTIMAIIEKGIPKGEPKPAPKPSFWHIATYTDEEERLMAIVKAKAAEWGNSQIAQQDETIVNDPTAYA